MIESPAKRLRRAEASLTRFLPKSFVAHRWEHLTDVSDTVSKMHPGPDGALWFVSKERQHNDRFQISVAYPDGKHDIVAFDLASAPNELYSHVPGELMFIDATGALCKAVVGKGISVIADCNARGFAAYDGGILVVPNDGRFQTLERRDTSGELQETFTFPFMLPKHYTVATNSNYLFFAAAVGSSMRRISLKKLDIRAKQVKLIAGSAASHEKGCQDGYGEHALFENLCRPTYTSATNCLHVRDIQPGFISRFCSVDLLSCKVTTLEIQGLETRSLLHVGLRFPHIFMLTKEHHLYYVDLNVDVLESTFLSDMTSVDWSAPCNVEFRLPSGTVVSADRRVLRARSSYFAAMLSPEHGMKESRGEYVDFTASDINPQAFRAVISYLATDDLHLSCRDGSLDKEAEVVLQDALFCIEIVALADLYELPRLQRVAEAFVLKVALTRCDTLVLPLLQKSWLTNSLIEKACWEHIGQHAARIFHNIGRQRLTSFLAKAPANLAAEMILRVAKTDLHDL